MNTIIRDTDTVQFGDRLQILLLILSEFKQIN